MPLRVVPTPTQVSVGDLGARRAQTGIRPMNEFASSTSSKPSTNWCKSKTTWARSLMKILSVVFKPCFSRASSSLKKEGTWITQPLPTRLMHFGFMRPLGKMWKSKVFPFATIVCPALLPPWALQHKFALLASISTSFPFPSSPNWLPRQTVTDMIIRGCGFVWNKVLVGTAGL